MNNFVFGKRSREKLQGVHPQLVEVAKQALKHSKIDFAVTEGVRTVETQKRLVAKGLSQTLNSKHIVQKDGYSHAIDVVPYPVNWSLEKFYPIAEAFREAAKELGVKVRWGGSWEVLNDTHKTARELVENYANARRKAGRKPFIDAVHFEIVA